MKLSLVLLLATAVVVYAETEDHHNRRFNAQPGGRLLVEVDFGSIEVSTNAMSEVEVDVVRKVTRGSKEEEEAFLADRPVMVSQEGDTITVRSRAESRRNEPSRGKQKTEGKYRISVPSTFDAELKTAGGAISVQDLTGEVNVATTGGNLTFAHLHGALDAKTAGGAIQVTSCEGQQQVKTSGGPISLSGGTGSFDGKTMGGPVKVTDFKGAVQVKSSGGGITIENASGKVDGKTSGGAISASFAAPITDEVNLATSGGAVTLRVPEQSAFDLDAASLGGNVRSDLPVDAPGKPVPNRLKGPVNGGGKPVVLHTSGGSIRVEKL
jgi:DUF4097 and DUF4098 domain-containing protein YvlB